VPPGGARPMQRPSSAFRNERSDHGNPKDSRRFKDETALSRSCRGLLERKLHLARFLRTERRRSPRNAGKIVCGLKDSTLSQPLPVTSGEVMDLGERGLRLDYNLPGWPYRWAYTGHGVHPKHFFYTDAASNPLGRDLTVVLSGRAPQERLARVTHVPPSDDLEILGLVFGDAKEPEGVAGSTIRMF
jgi:hypothetical protein